LQIQFFSDVTLCRCVGGFRRFGEWFSLHFQG